MEKIKVNEPIVDKEWESLILLAKNMGIEIEEIRRFLGKNKECKSER